MGDIGSYHSIENNANQKVSILLESGRETLLFHQTMIIDTYELIILF